MNNTQQAGQDRRGFLRAALLAGAVGASGGLINASGTAEAAARHKPVPRKTKARPKPKPRPKPRPKPGPKPGSAPKPKPVPILKPPAVPIPGPVPSTYAFALHLARRVTFGPTPELMAEISHAGTQAWLENQLDPASISDAACDNVLTRFPLAFADPPAVYAAMNNGDWGSMEAVVRATLARQAWSKRQLFEVMADFWSNHLNITTPSSEPWANKALDDKAVIRAHALGRFDDMLAASVRSPAMLLYLSNSESRGDAPNENYGRELMELHTVGVDAGYGHGGVINAARALTGMTVWNPWNGGTTANYGTFRYLPEWHWTGPLTVLGWTHPNGTTDGGEAVADSLARYLANHPATAARIAQKLAVRFVSDQPSQALVDQLTQTYLDNQTAIIPVLRALFASPEFTASTGQKFRRPAEDTIATIRTLGIIPDPASTSIEAISDLVWEIENLGNAPLGWDPPNGYPDVAPAWTGAGATLGRWNMHVGLTQGWWKNGLATPPDLAAYLLGPVLPATRSGLVAALTARLLPGHPLPTGHRTALVAFLGTDGPLQDGDATWLFPMLVAVILDSPYWSTR